MSKIKNPTQEEITTLLKYYQSGQYDAAEKLAIAMTQQFPRYQFGWKVLGVVFGLIGKKQDAVQANQQAANLNKTDPEAHRNLGNSLYELGKLKEAITSYRLAIKFNPKYTEAHVNLGNTMYDLGKLEEAEKSYKKAIAIRPDFTQAHSNLGLTLKDLGRFVEAEASLRQAIAIAPNFTQAHNNLGLTLNELGRFEEAETSLRQAITIDPDYAYAHNNLGLTLNEISRPQDAETSFRQAIRIKPNYAEAYTNLGNTLHHLGRYTESFNAIVTSINIKPTINAKSLFVSVSKYMIPQSWDIKLAKMVVTALIEPWERPSYVIAFASRLLKLDSGFIKMVDQIYDDKIQFTNASLHNIIDSNTSSSLDLFLAMLSSSPIHDYELERFFTKIRQKFLVSVANNSFDESEDYEVHPVLCYLAQQCFINEYVYFQTDKEIECLQILQTKLTIAIKNKDKVHSSLVIAVACYIPLNLILGAKNLLQVHWPSNVTSVLQQQICEPTDEFNLRDSIPCLTSTENRVSLEVQRMYEENPYPRWVRCPKDVVNPSSINVRIRELFNSSIFHPLESYKNPEILIAGCGTGQQPIGTAQLIKGASVLAIDLSMTSLSYAKRKANELGIKNLVFAQADLLMIGSLGRTFDVIESAGVLHHLENPLKGWEILISLLKPYGLMKLGFYSETARRDIVKVRNMIIREGIGSSAQEIRNYRKHLMELKDSNDFGLVTFSGDFFSTSNCRDLLFHVQEHRMTLPILAKFLKEHGLSFLGFEIDSSVRRSYKNRFPNDPSATDLNNWHIYEEENPDTFIEMYQFWCQKQH